mgnify:CR=1 FL=1
MAKGYGADPTLVSAAYRLGQSYGPADYTKIFEYQYEGLSEAIKAKYESYETMVKASADMVTDVYEGLEKKMGERDKESAETLTETGKVLTGDSTFDYLSEGQNFNKAMNELSTNYTDGVITDNKDNYSTSNPNITNKAEFKRDKEQFLAYKETIEEYSGKLYLTKNQKEKRDDAIKATLKLRETMNKHRGMINSKGIAWNSGFIDKQHSFENDPDLMFLSGKVLEKDGDMSKAGVSTFYGQDGHIYYKYPVGMANPILKEIQTKAKELENISLNLDTPTAEELAKKGGEMMTGKKEIGLEVPKLKTKELELPTSKEYKIIRADKLFAGLQEVDNATRNTLEAETANIINLAQETMTATDGKTKVASIENYNKISKKTENNIKNQLLKSTNYRNITNNPVLISGEEINWDEDLSENIEIDMAVINQDFIGSNVLTLDQLKNWDEDKSGTLDQDELNKHEEAKKMLIDKLLNPITQQEKEVSVNEFAKYINGYMKQVFDQTRERMDIESSEKGLNTRLVKAIESGQKNITIGRERFELQGGKYKLVQVLPQGSPTWVDFGEDVSYSVDEFIQDYGKRFKAK